MALVVLGVLATGPAFAKGPKASDQGRAEQHSSGGNHDDRRTEHRFDDRQRQTVYAYYESELRRGQCPPGLAKKHNGCVPPGHAKRYVIGQPLARDIIFYEVPRPVLVHLGSPPRGYRYVRVSNDILLLNAVTGIVVDALQNLGIAG